MNSLPLTHGPSDGDIFDDIAVALETHGYIVLPGLFPEPLLGNLFCHRQSLDEARFCRAGIGREDGHQVNRFVRTDDICWIDGTHPATRDYLDWMEQLRRGLNRRLFLGLFDYECHFAQYAPGAYYRRHRDAFRGNTNRVVTTVLYLNPEWQPADGGELLIYDEDSSEALERVMPNYGTLVVFLSERFPHEVLPAQRTRHSIAGWFRVNNSIAGVIDPPVSPTLRD